MSNLDAWLIRFRAWVRRHHKLLGQESAVILVDGRVWCVPRSASVTDGASYSTENTVPHDVLEAA